MKRRRPASTPVSTATVWTAGPPPQGLLESLIAIETSVMPRRGGPAPNVAPRRLSCKRKASPSSGIEGMAEAEAIAVDVVDIEIPAAVGLVRRRAPDGYALGGELRMQSVCVVDPEVGVPGVAVASGGAIG